MTTFNRLQVPTAMPEDTSSTPMNPVAGADASAMYPPQGASGLAEALGIELNSGFGEADSFLSLDQPEVLCNQCVHGHVLRSRAATQNRKPDGTPFYFLFGQCLRTSPPMALDDLRVEQCNQFTPKEPTP